MCCWFHDWINSVENSCTKKWKFYLSRIDCVKWNLRSYEIDWENFHWHFSLGKSILSLKIKFSRKITVLSAVILTVYYVSLIIFFFFLFSVNTILSYLKRNFPSKFNRNILTSVQRDLSWICWCLLLRNNNKSNKNWNKILFDILSQCKLMQSLIIGLGEFFSSRVNEF